MKTVNYSIPILLATFLISCGSPPPSTPEVSKDVIYDYDNTIDFKEFKSYQMTLLNEENNVAGSLNDLNKKRLENAILGNMGKKGMSLSAEPDIILAYGVNIDARKSFSSFGNMAGGIGVTTSEEYTTLTGTVTLALLEKGTEKLLWYASSSKELEGDRKNAERNINRIIAAIFTAFPVDHFSGHRK